MGDIFLGRIVKAFGIRGELKFIPSDDFWEDVLDSRRLVMQFTADGKVDHRDVALNESRPHGKRGYVVRLAGVNDRDSAESLVGSEIFIDEDKIDVTPPDELLPYQLVGMKVRAEAGEEMGKIVSVMYSPAHAIYEVGGERGTFMVPAVPEFVVSIDAKAKVLIIRPMPGLIAD